MHIGIIGLGSIGTRHARNIQKYFPSASIDILTKRKHWKEAGPRTRLTGSSRAFYETKHDVYFITNETHKHIPTLLRIVAQKPKGVFIEKPLSHSMKDLARVRSAVKKLRTPVVIGYSMQFFKPYTEIKKLLENGSIGKVLSMRISVGQDLRAWRTTDYRKGYSADNRRGGGVVLDLIHELNYPAWLIEEPLEVVAAASGKISELDVRAEDIGISILRSQRGVIVSVHQDYLQVPGSRTTEIIGTKGTLFWEWRFGTRKPHHIHLYTASGHRVKKITEERGEMYVRELKHFMREVRKGSRYTNIDEAIQDIRNAIQIRNEKIL